MNSNKGNTSNDPIITKSLNWCASSVRAACIRNDLYTLGDNDEYFSMLEKVSSTPSPTDLDIYTVAKDIVAHSECQDVCNVMYILANEAVTYLYDIDVLDA